MHPLTPRTPLSPRRWASLCVLLLSGAPWVDAGAWSLTIDAGPQHLFLHVGNGSILANNATINQVSVDVTGAQLMAGGALPMTSNSTQSTTLFGDGNPTCPSPASQLLVGASYRHPRVGGPVSTAARLSVTAPAALTSGSDSIAFSEISWTVAAPGSNFTTVISAGTFDGTLQLGVVPRSRYVENCHSFTYANSAVRAAGTYTGRVTYTLVTP